MKSFILSIVLILAMAIPSTAQVTPVAETNSAVTSQSSANQAPDDVIKKLSDLIHAEKYTEAQQLAAGLLLAYPDDQRLLKAKSLLDKLLASAKPTDSATQLASAVPDNSPPANSVAQPISSTPADQLTGMDKVEYNSLVELGHEAQQTTDLDQQKALLVQFINRSTPFLQIHPHEMLLWELYAASAITLDSPVAGYTAGQKLLASGSADNDPNMQRLLSQLNLKGWLDKSVIESVIDAQKKQGENATKFGWLLGTWIVDWKAEGNTQSRGEEDFQLSGSTINGYQVDKSGVKLTPSDLRGTILDTGEINWECYLPPANPGELYFFRKIGNLGSLSRWCVGRLSEPDKVLPSWYGAWQLMKDEPYYPFGWQPVISYGITNASTMIIVIPSQHYDSKSDWPLKHPVTLFFTKAGNAQSK